MRCVLLASFAHQKTIVIGAPTVVPQSLTNMLDQFGARATPTYWDDDDYVELLSP